jgi:cysteine-rich repeat protein
VRHSLVVLMAVLVARAAPALTVCSAGEIAASDPGCPEQGTCTITRDLEIPGSCTLDFGTRPVTVGEKRKIRVAPGVSSGNELTIAAGSFTMLPGAFIDGRVPAGADEDAAAASISVRTTGDVVLQRRGVLRARIDVSGGPTPGAIAIQAGGNVDARGPLTARGKRGGFDGGGSVGIEAAGTVDLADLIDVSAAFEGGEIDIEAGGDVIVRALHANGGGEVYIDAGRNVRILGAISLLGDRPDPGSQSYGGALTVFTEQGDLSIEAPITADPLSYGAGGAIELNAAGAISVVAGGHLSVRNIGLSELGEVAMYAGSSITTAARIDATGDVNGGTVFMEAQGDITVRAPLDTSGYGRDGLAGSIVLCAGCDQRVREGALLIDSKVQADGGMEARDIVLEGCDATVTQRGFVSARAKARGGPVTMTAHAALRIDGTVTARAFSSTTAAEDGQISLTFPENRPPAYGARGAVRPEPKLLPSSYDPVDFSPCPSCGNGVVEGAEECDDGNVTDCDGCDSNCTFSSTCGNGIRCGAEQCDPPAGTPNAACCDATCHYRAANTPCDDGELCTHGDACDAAGACAGSATPLPMLQCRQPPAGRSSLQIVDSSPDEADRVTWRWEKGQLNSVADFGDPQASTSYALCVYDQSDASPLRLAIDVGAGGLCPARPCWKSSGNGFRYAARTAAASGSGVTEFTLATGADNQARLALLGKGAALSLPRLPFAPPVSVQLRNTAGACWGATYSTPTVNNVVEYSAKSD